MAEETTVETTVDNTETTVETTVDSTETTDNSEIISEAEAAVANLKLVKRALRQTELTDLEKAELTDAMEEIAVQYGKIQGLYQTTKERIVKVAKVIGGCLVVAVVVFGVVKLVL